MRLSPTSRYDEIQMDIVDFLSEFGEVSYPFDIFCFISSLGITLTPYSSLPLEARNTFVSIDQDGFTARRERLDVRTTTIYYNDIGVGVERIRFTLAHELTHLILDHPSSDEPYESEANYGAGYILAPAPVVLAFSKNDAQQISSDFGLSWQSAEVARRQALSRSSYGRPFFPHEEKLLSLVEWEGR